MLQNSTLNQGGTSLFLSLMHIYAYAHILFFLDKCMPMHT